MSDTESIGDPGLGEGVQRVSNKEPAVGMVVTADNAPDVAITILCAQERGYEAIVATKANADFEGVSFARKLGAIVVDLPRSEMNGTSAREHLTEVANQRGFPGLLFVSQPSAQIDFGATKEKFHSRDEFSTTALSQNQSSSPTSVLAIVPAYNEDDTLEDIVRKTKLYVDKVVVIDDCSSDCTLDVAEKVADGVISHPKNMGVGGAVHTGYQAAIKEQFDVVIQIDGDGQHDPAHIPEMLQTMEENEADMVIGSRWLNGSHKEYSFVRRAGIKFFTLEANLLGNLDITDVTSGFRAYSVEMISDLGKPENSHWALEQTIEAGRKDYNIEEVSIPMSPETTGSQFTLETFLKYPPRMVLTSLKVLLFR